MLTKLKSLKNHKEFMKYFNNTSWLFVDKIFKMLLGFFVIMYLTRYLGPEQFGLLSYSQSFVSIFMAFTGLGLGSLLIRDLMLYPEDINKLMGTVFYLVLTSSVVAIFLIFIIDYLLLNDENTKYLILVISITIIFNNLNMVIDHYFQYKILSRYIVYCNTIGFISSSIIKCILIYFKYDLIYFAYVLLFDSIFLSLAFVFIYNKQGLSIVNWRFNTKLAKQYLKVSFPLIMVGVLSVIYTRTDQIMIKFMLDDIAVGNYAAAVKLSELFYFIPSIIVTSLFPKLVELKKQNEERYFKLLEKIFKLVVWISIPIAMVISSFSTIIIDTLYGSEFTQSSGILAILSWGIVFVAQNAIFVKILYIEHYEKKYLYKSIFGVGVNIILNYFLIQIYGVNGAALSTLITLFSINYLYDILDKELYRFYYLKFVCFGIKLKKGKK